MKRVEFKVFTNLTKDELDLQHSLESGRPRFGGGDASDGHYLQSQRNERESALDSIKSLEESELAEFRMRSFNKTINKPSVTSTTTSVQSETINTDTKSSSSKFVNPIIIIKPKKRPFIETKSLASDSESKNTITKTHKVTNDIASNNPKQYDKNDNFDHSKSNLPVVPQTKADSKSVPNILPFCYYSDDEEDS